MTSEHETLLPTNATPWLLANEQTSGERWAGLDVGIIARFKDPWTCPDHLLNFLAFERSVDIWDDAWPTWKKRSVIASAPQDHRLKGTEEGIRRYLAITDAELLQVVTPPQGFYLARDLTKEEWDAWIDQMPRLRITLARGTREWVPPIGFFLDHCALEVDILRINDGPALHGRRAFLRNADGTETPLQFSEIVDTMSAGSATVTDRIVIPGISANGLVLDQGALDKSFMDAVDISPKFFTFRLDRSYDHAESELALTSVSTGLEPLDVRYRRVSEIGDGGPYFHMGDHADGFFLGPNIGGELLADVLYLHDPDTAAPLVDAISFLDHSRFGMPDFTAEMMVSVPHVLPEGGFVLDLSAFGDAGLRDEDQHHLDLALDAVASSKALRDKILMTFQTTRERTLDDGIPLDGTAILGDRIPNSL